MNTVLMKKLGIGGVGSVLGWVRSNVLQSFSLERKTIFRTINVGLENYF